MEFETFEENIVCDGDGVKWPERCRNCQDVYSGELKTQVTRLVRSGDMTLLKAVSTTLLDNGITKYCCLNNFKPKTETVNVPGVVREMFVEIRPRVLIDKTMADWIDITWDCDNYEENVKDIKRIQPEELSLFEL